MLMVREVHEHADEYLIGGSEWYEPYTDDLGELFRSCRSDHGRCEGKVWIDRAVAFHPPVAEHCGWTFLKRQEYSDSTKTYLHRTWVIYKEVVDRAA